MIEEGGIEDNAQAPIHFQAGKPVDWRIEAHWDNAGVTSWSLAPQEPISALLTDLGPIALADYSAELQGATPGAHLHSVIGARTGAWFDWYRGLIDPMVRTPAQTATLKQQVAQSLRRATVQALVR